jgi:cobalt/nickel transport system permease protein
MLRDNSGTGLVRSIDTRLKAAFGVAALILCLSSSAYHAPLFVGAACMALTAIAGVRARMVILRLIFPITLAIGVSIFRAPFSGGETLYAFGIFGHIISIGSDAPAEAALLLSRVFGGVSVALFVTMTSTAQGLLHAAAWFRVPTHLVEILMLSYRYVFLLMDDARTVRQSQLSRLGYANLRISMRSLGTLSGAVLLRAINQAEATSAAMTLRGYTGSYLPQSVPAPFKASHAALLATVFFAALSVYIWA